LVEAGKRFGKGGWTFAVSAKVKTTLNCRKNEISCRKYTALAYAVVFA